MRRRYNMGRGWPQTGLDWRPRRYRARRLPRWRGFIFLLLASAITVWCVGQLRAVPDRPEILVPVYRHDLDETVLMELEEYVKGVVAAEMPAEFHLEALKAQAVAARTLAVRIWHAQQPLPGRPDAVLSTDPAVHQAWYSPEVLRQRWGAAAYYGWWEKVSRAVTQTRGLVLVHGDELIFPAYHASSGGRTEDSENYWSSPIPYLRSVEDPYIAGSRYEVTHATFALAEVAQKTGAGLVQASPSPWIEVLSRFPSGRVEQVRVGEKTLSGRQLREALGLRSNWFDVREDGGQVVFDVYGYGHGIGMSQYGANGMAAAGFTFDQILSHYYTGVEIVAWYE